MTTDCAICFEPAIAEDGSAIVSCTFVSCSKKGAGDISEADLSRLDAAARAKPRAASDAASPNPAPSKKGKKGKKRKKKGRR